MAKMEQYNTDVIGRKPSPGDLTPGQIATNSADGKVYMLKDDGTKPAEVVEVGGLKSIEDKTIEIVSGVPNPVELTLGRIYFDPTGPSLYTLASDGTTLMKLDFAPSP